MYAPGFQISFAESSQARCSTVSVLTSVLLSWQSNHFAKWTFSNRVFLKRRQQRNRESALERSKSFFFSNIFAFVQKQTAFLADSLYSVCFFNPFLVITKKKVKSLYWQCYNRKQLQGVLKIHACVSRWELHCWLESFLR